MKKTVKPYNHLTLAQVERLAILSEELGEAVQAIGKVLRHGYGTRCPSAPLGPTSQDLLETELGDVLFAMSLLTDAKDLDCDAIDAAEKKKSQRSQLYFHHQEDK